MSTFLKERDLAGLKVCSVRSSPSILSVQSERGASCNSKLRGQSPPGPAEHIAQSAAPGSRAHAARRHQQPGQGWCCGVHTRATEPTGWPPPQTATGPLPWQVESKASGGNLTVRDNYLHSYLQDATRAVLLQKRVQMCITFTGTCCIFPSSMLSWTATHTRTTIHHTHPPPAVPQLLLEPGRPGPKQAACTALTQACTTRSRLGGHGPGHADARTATQGKGADYFSPQSL